MWWHESSGVRTVASEQWQESGSVRAAASEQRCQSRGIRVVTSRQWHQDLLTTFYETMKVLRQHKDGGNRRTAASRMRTRACGRDCGDGSVGMGS